MMYDAIYYPTWDPPAEWLRSTLLVFDRVQVLLPEGVHPAREEPNTMLIDAIPDAFGEVKKARYELTVGEPNLRVLDSALAEIAVLSRALVSSPRVAIDSAGGISRDGFTFLHVSKLNPDVERLLEDRGLLMLGGGEMAGRPDMRLVEAKAANLIVSLAAETHAREKGLRTITDEPLDFLLLSLNRAAARQQDAIAMSLASAVIALEVPGHLKELPIGSYVEIRNRYEGLREPFHRTMRDLCSSRLLTPEMSRRDLDEAIEQTARQFFAEVEKIRQHPWSRKITDWVPVGLGALTTVLSALWPDLPAATPALSGAGVMINVYKNLRPPVRMSDQDQAMNLMAGMRSKLVEEVLIRRLVDFSDLNSQTDIEAE